MLQVLQRVFTRGSTTETVVECRRCGTNLCAADLDVCPACNSDEIARYTF